MDPFLLAEARASIGLLQTMLEKGEFDPIAHDNLWQGCVEAVRKVQATIDPKKDIESIPATSPIERMRAQRKIEDIKTNAIKAKVVREGKGILQVSERRVAIIERNHFSYGGPDRIAVVGYRFMKGYEKLDRHEEEAAVREIFGGKCDGRRE